MNPPASSQPTGDGDRHSDPKPADSSSAAPAFPTGALIGPRAAADLADTFKVLGDLTRVRMLDALSHSELCVGDLAGLLGLTESAVSHQLRLLRGMRLVRSRREGRMVIYMLDDEHIVKLFRQGLDHIEESSGQSGGDER